MRPREPPPSAPTGPANPAGLQLLESQEKLRAFFESNLVGIVFGEASGKLVEANDEFLRLSGYGREDLESGLTWRDLTAPEFRHLDEKSAQEAGSRGACAPYEKQYIRKDGTRLWVLVGYALLGLRRDRSVAFALDIDARKRAESALDVLSRTMEKRERLMRATLSSISDLACTFDREGRFLFANQTLLTLWGIPLEQAVGRNFLELGYPPDLAAKLQRQVQSVFETGTTVTDETAYTSPSGNPGHYEYILSPGLDAEGHIDFVVGSTRDVSARKAAEIALRKSVEEFQGLAEAMPQMVWVTRPDGWNTYFSPQWMAYTGLTAEESSGHGWIKPFHPDDRQAALEAWERATTLSGTYAIESRLRRADGLYRWFLIRGVPQRDSAEVIVKWFGTCTDIHDMKLAQLAMALSEARFAKLFHSRLLPIAITRIESRLLQAQKMEAVGRLAGGVAHDLDILLGVIKGYIELLPPEASGTQQEGLEQVLRASQSAAKLTQQLLASSRSQIVNPQSLDLDLLFSDLQKMLGRLIGEDIDIGVLPGPEIGRVKADRGQLEQAVLNLCAYALRVRETPAKREP